MTETNADLARRGYEAALNGELELIADLLAPDIKWHGGDPSWEGACHNREDALAVMRRAAGDGAIGELVDVVEAGDKVVVIMRPPPEEGEEPRLVANLSTFRDGKVVEMVHYPDPDEALAAAGV
ncbi:MAG: nuclear transport factor 2 family protein [Actinobacteria bacterium]|nr:nuclear transport factor 2 family protein [Actinomycetota bacterium]